MPPTVYRDMQYDNDEACHSKQNSGKLHCDISRNGYGNAIIGRYGGCGEDKKEKIVLHQVGVSTEYGDAH